MLLSPLFSVSVLVFYVSFPSTSKDDTVSRTVCRYNMKALPQKLKNVFCAQNVALIKLRKCRCVLFVIISVTTNCLHFCGKDQRLFSDSL